MANRSDACLIDRVSIRFALPPPPPPPTLSLQPAAALVAAAEGRRRPLGEISLKSSR